MRYDLTDGVSYHSIEAATTDAAEAEARRWIEGGDYLHPESLRTTCCGTHSERSSVGLIGQ